MDFHISTVVVSFGLFFLALNTPVVPRNPILFVGERLYMWIYLSHIFCGSLYDNILDTLVTGGIEYIRPVAVLAMSCGFALVMELIAQTSKLYRKAC